MWYYDHDKREWVEKLDEKSTDEESISVLPIEEGKVTVKEAVGSPISASVEGELINEVSTITEEVDNAQEEVIKQVEHTEDEAITLATLESRDEHPPQNLPIDEEAKQHVTKVKVLPSFQPDGDGDKAAKAAEFVDRDAPIRSMSVEAEINLQRYMFERPTDKLSERAVIAKSMFLPLVIAETMSYAIGPKAITRRLAGKTLLDQLMEEIRRQSMSVEGRWLKVAEMLAKAKDEEKKGATLEGLA